MSVRRHSWSENNRLITLMTIETEMNHKIMKSIKRLEEQLSNVNVTKNDGTNSFIELLCKSSQIRVLLHLIKPNGLQFYSSFEGQQRFQISKKT